MVSLLFETSSMKPGNKQDKLTLSLHFM